MLNRLIVLYVKLWDMIQRMVLKKRRRAEVMGYINKQVLTKEQKQAVKEYYAPYRKVSPVYHNFYTEKTGEFHPECIPDDVWFNEIDCYFNRVKDAKVLDNKCFYAQMFPDVKQPDTVLYRMNGLWYTKDMKLLTYDEAKEMITGESALFMKQATDSFGGHGVSYLDAAKGSILQAFLEVIDHFIGDVIIQRPLKQHADIAKLNPSSVNTLRILTMLRGGKVTVLSSVIRMGKGDSKVDNACSGGVNCGITENGRLQKHAYTWSGIRFDKHPTSGIAFEGYQLPSYDKVIEMVKRLQESTPHFRLVSWDIAIDEAGEPVLVEANLSRGGLFLHQLNNGPVFGEDTREILNEVFHKNK